MIASALISECRRDFNDVAKRVRVERNGDGVINIFNVGRFPVIEGSYAVYVAGTLKTETTHYTYDLDSGDLSFVSTPSNGEAVKSEHKYAEWRDKNWNEAINTGIEALNARGFFRQVVRNTSIFRLSANVQSYSGPSACVDLYELLVSDNYTISGNFIKPRFNWSYYQDANKIVVGGKPAQANRAAISYLRNMKTYSATSATLDILDDWKEAVKMYAGAKFYRYMAGKVAKQGNATVDEGHFSFTNLRTMASDLEKQFSEFASRKKPTRPAKDLQWQQAGGGVA